MEEVPNVGPSSGRPPEDRLGSWKEIAGYLGRDVTTVQRWEKREGMPVHRHLHDRLGSIYAFRSELDAWASTRNLRGNPGKVNDSLPSDPATQSLSSTRVTARWKAILPLTAAGAALAIAAGVSIQSADYFWRNPIAEAQYQNVTDFEGLVEAAAISRDGHFIAFVSDKDGPADVWVTQAGSGRFQNLTRGRAGELVNPAVRTLGFSQDGSLVTFWNRRRSGSNAAEISIWAVPTLGGEPRPYMEGAAELDWSQDGSQLAYHTPGPGDPLYVTNGSPQPGVQPVFTAPTGLHSHFPLWAPDKQFLYFVQGSLPDKMDIWRIHPAGGPSERITSHSSRLSHPVLLNRRTLLYLASDADGSGPWLYSMDLERRIPHRLSAGPERYTSLAASADGRRLVATLASPKTTLWRLPMSSAQAQPTGPARISLTTRAGFFPRFGPGYLLYVATTGTSASIWKIAGGASTELWTGQGVQMLGAPAISSDGGSVAFSVAQEGKKRLYTMRSDGTNARILTGSLELAGAPAWAPDGKSISSAVEDHGVPRLFRIPVDGGAPAPLVKEYSVDPVWTPDGGFAIYSGPDIGTTFSLRATTATGETHPLPPIVQRRGTRHLAMMPGGHAIVIPRGEIRHKDLWLVDLATGSGRQLTNFPKDFDIRDFDVSPDGHDIVVERLEQHSDVVLLELPQL